MGNVMAVKSWKIIKGIMNKKKCSRIMIRFIINGVQTTNGKRIANGFKDLYVNIRLTLASKIGNTDIDPTDYVKSINNTSTVFVEPVDKDEVSRIIKTLKNSSPGLNSNSSTVVKNTCHHFFDPLTHLFNASLLQ